MFKRYGKALAGALAVLAAVGAVHLYGGKRYLEGVDDERARLAKQAITAAQSRAKTDQAVGRLPNGAAADELRHSWSRD